MGKRQTEIPPLLSFLLVTRSFDCDTSSSVPSRLPPSTTAVNIASVHQLKTPEVTHQKHNHFPRHKSRSFSSIFPLPISQVQKNHHNLPTNNNVPSNLPTQSPRPQHLFTHQDRFHFLKTRHHGAGERQAEEHGIPPSSPAIEA